MRPTFASSGPAFVFVFASWLGLVASSAQAITPNFQISGSIAVSVQSANPWTVVSPSPTWVATPLFGCTETVEAIFEFENQCTWQQERLICTKTVCRLPDFTDPFGGLTETTTFSDECVYCIENPDCCDEVFEVPDLPDYECTDGTWCSLSGPGTVPIDLDYSIEPTGSLTEIGQETGFDGSRTIGFGFVRPPGPPAPAQVDLPWDLILGPDLNLVADTLAPNTIAIGRFELRVWSPQLGLLFRSRVVKPLDTPATIVGDIPPGEFTEDAVSCTLSDAQGAIAPVQIPAFLDQVDVFVEMTYSYHTSVDCEPFVRGDVTGDDIMNVGDMIQLLSHIFSGGSTVGAPEATDVNGDGMTNVADGIFGLIFLFGFGPPPPAPFPEPGCP